VLGLLLGGCGLFGGSDDSSGTPSAGTPSRTPSQGSGSPTPVPAGLSSYYDQELSWTSCQDTFECAQLRVPLDYAEPAGTSIRLALLRVPATGDRVGSMVINPGGPGASGVDYATAAQSIYGRSVRDRYDVVGFDPRGVDRSDPVECASDEQFDTLLSSDPDPDTAAERRYSDGLLRSFGRGCLQRSPGIAQHMSTVEVAKDLDVLRAALGDRRLTYFGASYGTAIGATYADLFPRNVGRMVLDGALDPESSTLEINLVQAQGFETALRAYVGACVDRGGCFLGSTVDEGTRRIRTFLDSVESSALPASGGRELSIGNAVYGISAPLYNTVGWPTLDQALQNAFAGDGSLLMVLADGYLGRNTDGTFKDNSFQAFYAVNCLDHDDAVPGSRLASVLPRFEKASPTFGAIFAYSTSACEQWPIHTGKGPLRVKATGSPAILVIGTTRDPATPLVWAQALAEQLPQGHLIIRDGDGHTGYDQGSFCVDHAVDSYLVDGQVPGATLRCS
jgi:pimeloyl-ACP methyl ester carboxylesterase